MTIKHLMYTPKVPFLNTERACVLFSGFGIRLGKFFMSTEVYLPEGVEQSQFCK